MTEPNDPFDTWLHMEPEPLPPPPGTFDQIRKRARRRKTRRALVSAASAGAAAAVIVVAVVALPRVVPTVLHTKSNPAAASSATSGPRAVLGRGTHTPASRSPAPSTGALPQVPPNFAPTSVTFVGRDTGWVIGQAGTPGHCSTQYCTSVAETGNAGQSWFGVPAPLAGAPDGSSGVSQIRFLNTEDGWAFGPQLWATHDGGQHWTPVSTGRLRVTSLETVDGEAFAVFAQCAGTGADFAADCTRFWLYAAPAGSNDWRTVPGMTSFSSGQASSATILLTEDQGYLYTPDGTLLTGPVTGTSPWQPVSPTPLPCAPGVAEADGQPAAGQLAASGTGDLALVCPSPDPAAGQAVYTSVDGGQTWQQQGTLPVNVPVTSLAAGTGGGLAAATTQGIEVSSNDGRSWTETLQGVGGGFSYVGLTSQLQGVAVPAAPGLSDSVWFTTDGGQSWSRSQVTNP